MKRDIRHLLLSFLAFALWFGLAGSPVSAAQGKAINAGLTVLDFAYTGPDGRKETLTTAVWYPSYGPEKEYSYMGSWRKSYKGKVALNAPPIEHTRPLPVLFYMTGLYGSGISSSFLAEYLARQGYVVIGPDLNDTAPPTYKDQIAWNRIGNGNTFKGIFEALKTGKEFLKDMENDQRKLLDYLNSRRLPQALFVMDETISLAKKPGSFFYGLIDRDRIGLCGHSIGGITALAIIGCHPEKKYHSDRIKTALLLSPGVYPFEQTLGNIRIPIMVMVGEKDPPNLGPDDVPRQTVYHKAPPPKYLCLVKGGEHLDFTDGVCGSTGLSQCAETEEKANVVCRYGLAFLNKHLRDDDSTSAQLTRKDEGLVYFAQELQPGKFQEWGSESGTGKKERPRLFKRK